MESKKKEIDKNISEGRISNALNLLHQSFSEKKAILLIRQVEKLQGDFRRNETEYIIQNTISKAEYDRKLSKITIAAQKLSEEIIRSGKRRFLAALAFICCISLILLGFYFYEYYFEKNESVITEEIPTQNKVKVEIGIVLNGYVHYTNAIRVGFRNEIEKILQKTTYKPHIEYTEGSPTPNDTLNENVFKELFSRFSDCEPDYLITIGTNVSEYANENYLNDIPIIFIGVTDPIKSGLSSSYGAELDRGNICGVKYGLFADEYVNFFEKICPNKRIGIIYSPQYQQDIYFKDDLIAADIRASNSNSIEIVPILSNSAVLNPDELDKADIFMGRYLVSTGLYKFLKEENRPFLGSSIQNINRGAIAILGLMI